MPKVSHEQALAEMEGVLGAVRANAGRLLPLATQVADNLEARIAEIKAMRIEQEDLLAMRILKTGELMSLIAQGNRAARDLRAFVVLALGTRHPLLKQFGIGIRGRRSRGARKSPARDVLSIAAPEGRVAAGIGEPPERMGETSGDLGESTFGIGEPPPRVGEAVSPVGETPGASGGRTARMGEASPRSGGPSRDSGETAKRKGQPSPSLREPSRKTR